MLTFSFLFALQTLLIATTVFVLMVISSVKVETKPLIVDLNGTIKTVNYPRKVLKSLLEDNEIFKAVPDYTQISSDFEKFKFIRDLYKDQCKTIKTEDTLSDGIVPIKVPKAKCEGRTCNDCRCNPIKIMYQLVKRTGISKDHGKHINELINQEVTVAFRPLSRSCLKNH